MTFLKILSHFLKVFISSTENKTKFPKNWPTVFKGKIYNLHLVTVLISKLALIVNSISLIKFFYLI